MNDTDLQAIIIIREQAQQQKFIAQNEAYWSMAPATLYPINREMLAAFLRHVNARVALSAVLSTVDVISADHGRHDLAEPIDDSCIAAALTSIAWHSGKAAW